MVSHAGPVEAAHRRAERATWRSLDSTQLVVIAVAVLTMTGSVVHVAAVGVVQPSVAFIFGVLIAVGELFRMAMPGGREVAPVASAGAMGYAMLVTVGEQPAGHGPAQVVAVAAAGMFVGSLPHAVVGRPLRLDAPARRLILVALVAVGFRPIAASSLDWRLVLALMGVCVITACLLDLVIAAMIRAEAVRARLGMALRDEAAAKMALCASIGATAIVIAVATDVMGRSALLVFTAPILITQFAFRRYAGVRATYLQTIRALSRVTEVGGYVETGHSARVARLSVAMGRELGMSEQALLDLEYAALMHDIGQLSLRDPIPGGATVLASPVEQRRIAELGAEVIKQTGVLDRVAQLVHRQADPYLAGDSDGAPPALASRVIKVANAYDDLVGDSGDRDRGAAVLERLRLDSRTEYDPAVVEALGRVLARRRRR